MTLLVTVIAAVISTIVWYAVEKRDTYKLGTLSFIYWGASLMWFIDFVAEYSELHADYFIQNSADMLNDFVLGITVTVIGLIAWLLILLVKDPKGVFRKKLINQSK